MANTLLAVFLAQALALSTAGAYAQQADNTPTPAAAVGAEEQAVAENAELYCRNIANAAADARYQRQVDALAALEQELDKRIAALEAKRAELEEWMQRRSNFLAKADESVVAIYSQMRPDAASGQIAVMDAEAAAAILSKLTPRTASAILNEMDATTAAFLASVMAGLPAAVRVAIQ